MDLYILRKNKDKVKIKDTCIMGSSNDKNEGRTNKIDWVSRTGLN